MIPSPDELQTFHEFCYLLAGRYICLSTESDILALATRVQKSLKDDGASTGINNAATIIKFQYMSRLV